MERIEKKVVLCYLKSQLTVAWNEEKFRSGWFLTRQRL